MLANSSSVGAGSLVHHNHNHNSHSHNVRNLPVSVADTSDSSGPSLPAPTAPTRRSRSTSMPPPPSTSQEHNNTKISAVPHLPPLSDDLSEPTKEQPLDAAGDSLPVVSNHPFRTSPRSFSDSRNHSQHRLSIQNVPRNTILKALASARPCLESVSIAANLRETATMPPSASVCAPQFSERTPADFVNSTLSPPLSAKMLQNLQSPCFYHQRFDSAVNVQRVLEEISDDEFTSHSRLMQTALGVREVARQLQRRTCKVNVRNVMIVTKARDNELVTLTREVAHWLMKTPRYGNRLGVNVYVDKKLRDSKRFNAKALLEEEPAFRNQLRYWTPDLCWNEPESFDLVLTLGGDGTVLFTSWLFQRVVPPILSFSLGSLGFLTNFKFDLYREILDKVLGDGMRVNMRMRFTCTVYRDEDGVPVEKDQFEVLNELVIDRGPSPYVSNLELYGDDDLLTVVQADGCIFSTPTGSTAYSLSAGGSLVHPDIPAILLTPICPHSLSFRPMLLNDSMLLRVSVPKNSRATAWCAFDGKGRIELKQGDHVTIAASQYPFPTVMSLSTEWVDSVSRTLRWNTRAQQKAWDGEKTGDNEEEEGFDIDTDSGCYNSDSEEGTESPIGRKMALLNM